MRVGTVDKATNENVKICHISSAHKRYDGRIFKRECLSLAQAGYDVTLLINDNEKSEVKDGINIISLNNVAKGRLERFYKTYFDFYKAAIKIDADIYHLHDPDLLLIAKRLKKAGKTVIFDSHETYYLQIKNKYWIAPFLRNIISKVYFSYETRICRLIDAVIVPCTMDGKNTFDGRANRVLLSNNYPSLDDFYNKVNHTCKKYDLCYVGGLSPQRGIDLIVDAAIKTESSMLLVGKFVNQDYQKQILSRIEGTKIKWIKPINYSEVYKIYNQCKIGLSCLLNVGQYGVADNMPTKNYEYMSMGLPVVMHRSRYIERINGKFNFGIVVETDTANQIIAAINTLKQNEQLCNELGDNGRALIKSQFNWNKESEKLVELYQKIRPM